MSVELSSSVASAPGNPLQGALSIQHVSKRYHLPDRELAVLQDIHLDIRPGEFTSIVGASGCGKSTLLRLIVGLDQDYTGDIVLDGDRVRGTSLDRGIVFQDHRLFPWMTVQDNIELALLNSGLSRERKRAIVSEHIRLVRLEGFEHAFPKQLSGGMAQRAAIARALVNRPKLLLLDEPLGALDALTRLHLQKELQRIWMEHRTTVVMVTHDVEEAVYLSDRIIVMDANPGRVRQVIGVPLPHSRDRAAPALRRIRDEILSQLTAGSAEQGSRSPAQLRRVPV